MKGEFVRRLAIAGLGTALVARCARIWLRTRRTVAPDLRHPVLFLPLNVTNRTALRAFRWTDLRRSRIFPGVDVREHLLPPRDDRPAVQVHVYEPPARQRPSGALLWIHGGGFVAGHPRAYHDRCSRFAAELGILVISVTYRLAPEHPFPAGLEDCFTALTWLHQRSADLGVDPSRIAIGGDSAGGGLTAALAQLAHDRGGTPACFQLLVYPMLDDRTVLRNDHAGTGAFAWTPASNRFGWTAYLGHPPSRDEPRPYAVPARRHDLSGLPPAWIGVGNLDLFHAEAIAYAQRLTVAGVPCELVVVPQMYHGADVVVGRKSPTMSSFVAGMTYALKEALS